MKILGGLAFVNQVSFFSTNYRVTASSKRHTIDISWTKRTAGERFSKAYDIPFLRGAVRLFSLLLSKVTVFLLILLFILDWLVSKITFVLCTRFDIMLPTVGRIPVNEFTLFIILLVFIKVLIGKYHGAEHKVFNTWLEGKAITLENVRAASRVSQKCGTNLVVFIALLDLPLSFVLPFFVSTIISISVGYELFKSKRPYFQTIAKVFYRIGGLLQYLMFTAEPSDKELEVAVAAFTKLLELENVSVE